MKITVKGLAYDKCSVNDSYEDEGGGGRRTVSPPALNPKSSLAAVAEGDGQDLS